MTMPVLGRMQRQKAAKKRSAATTSVGHPSPKRPRRGPSGFAPSPRSSPMKGPFVDSDTDSPTFMTRSFYGGRRQQSSAQGEKYHLKSSLLTPSSSLTTASLSNSQILSAEKNSPSPNKKLNSAASRNETSILDRSPRVVLSPLKTPDLNPLPQNPKPKARKPERTRKRHSSLPAEVPRCASKRVSTPGGKKERQFPAEVTTPNSDRKFFKHKSPVSASKAVGGIIIGRGFNLKFVPHALIKSKNSKKSSQNTKRSAVSKKLLSQVEKTYSRMPKTGGVKTPFTEMTTGARRSPSKVSHLANPLPGSQAIDLKTSSDENLSTDFSDPVPQAPGSHSLFSSDTQSLASDDSAPSFDPILTSQDSESLSLNSAQTVSTKGESSPNSAGKRRSHRLATQHHSSATPSPKTKLKFIDKEGQNQLVLDAGQKKYGMTQCRMCGMVYALADPADESMHAKFHQHTISVLKFPGWKKERVTEEFLDDGSRVICVLPEDQNFMTRKVEEVNRIMSQELGFPDQVFTFRPTFKAFFYVSNDKRIEGCCIAESIKEGYRVLPNRWSETPESQRPWFCSKVAEQASVGIGRLWVYGPSRQRGIATRLVNCVRQWFEYGMVIDKSEVAFSDPTPDGRRFAANYTGTSAFLVYKYIP